MSKKKEYKIIHVDTRTSPEYITSQLNDVALDKWVFKTQINGHPLPLLLFERDKK